MTFKQVVTEDQAQAEVDLLVVSALGNDREYLTAPNPEQRRLREAEIEAAIWRDYERSHLVD